MNWYLNVLKNYAGFSGRARRTEYWMFVLISTLISIVLQVIDNVAIGYPVLSLIYALGVFIPGLAVAVRRLHDIGKSGGWIFIGFIPLVGVIWLIVLLASAGNPGPNAYGPDPKQTAPAYA